MIGLGEEKCGLPLPAANATYQALCTLRVATLMRYEFVLSSRQMYCHCGSLRCGLLYANIVFNYRGPSCESTRCLTSGLFLSIHQIIINSFLAHLITIIQALPSILYTSLTPLTLPSLSWSKPFSTPSSPPEPSLTGCTVSC